MPKEPTFSFGFPNAEERLRELILYIAEESREDIYFGAVKLNKILWMADFMAYAQRGEPLTGVPYQRLQQGPAPRRLAPVRNAMIRAKEVQEVQQQRGKHTQKRLLPLRAADTSLFEDWQIELVDGLIKSMQGVTAKELTAFSHGVAWRSAAEKGALIPYEAAFLSDEPPDAEDVARTGELAARHGW